VQSLVSRIAFRVCITIVTAVAGGMLLLGFRAPADWQATDTFVDPTAELPSQEGRLRLDGQVYIAPFARITAAPNRHVKIGEQANVQDNAQLDATECDILLGERAVVAHGAVVRASKPAAIAADTKKPAYRNPGIEAIESYMESHPKQLRWGGVPSFVGFNASVDGATLADGSMVMHLAKVGPGVNVASGMVILPGKRVSVQEEADNPALGKVAYLTEADVAFMLDVVEVNTQLAEGYNKLAKENPEFVRGINVDPGVITGNEARSLPTIAGIPTHRADTGKHRFRIIGDVRIADIAGIHSGVSIRADEGPTMLIGRQARLMGSNTLHALAESNISAGNQVTLAPRAVIHGGHGDHLRDGTWTDIGDRCAVGAGSVIFRSKLGSGVQVGANSLVMDSVVPDGTVIPSGEVWSGGTRLYSVE
jgi:carbonic anhydrase/acetyltransferase-like protein (isoleucine patch superfamily)